MLCEAFLYVMTIIVSTTNIKLNMLDCFSGTQAMERRPLLGRESKTLGVEVRHDVVGTYRSLQHVYI